MAFGRRSFLGGLGASLAGACVSGCSRVHGRTTSIDGEPPPYDGAALRDASGRFDVPPDAHPIARPLDAGTPVDGGADADVAGPVIVVAPFTVYLVDPSCSGHDHSVEVEAGTYPRDLPVELHAQHHPLVFTGQELSALDRGEQLPFATLPHDSHHHCGTAVRQDVFLDALGADRERLQDFFGCRVPDAPPPGFAGEYGSCTLQEP